MKSSTILTLLLAGMLSGSWSRPADHSPQECTQKVRTFYDRASFDEITKGRVAIGGIPASEAAESLLPILLQRLLASKEVTVVAQREESELWVGTLNGAVRVSSNGTRVEYLAGKRWLPGDQVLGFGFVKESGAVWIETSAGFSRLEFRPTALLTKAAIFQENVRSRHLRHGFTADSRLDRPGDLASNRTVSTDNDGLWTAMYLASECYRFRVTSEPDAAANARQALRALLRLEEITGIPGFPARSIIQIGVDEQPKDGEWHTTSDGKWRWKGDTSSDEIVGHYYAYSIFHDLLATPEEKQTISAAVDRITNHILDNGYHLIDVDGKHTRWGWWAPDEIWDDPDETGLRALHMLSHLRVAIQLTQTDSNKIRFKRAYDELIADHQYHLLTRNQKINYPGHVNHSDDELAFLSYYPLLLYERNPELRRIYVESLDRSWRVERPERNPLWNFIYAAGTGETAYDLEESLQTLCEIPLDQISWTVTNSHRQDVELDPYPTRFGRSQSLSVLPYDELPVLKWNANPYRLDGGSGGRKEGDGVYFLLPYWMGRYHKLF